MDRTPPDRRLDGLRGAVARRDMKSIAEFVKERDAALLTLNRDVILAMYQKWADDDDYNRMFNARDEVFWASVHKARTAATSLPLEARHASKTWLSARGLSSMDDGEL